MLFDAFLSSLASWLLLGCAGWAGLLCAGAVLETRSRGRLRATVWLGCPRAWRRVLLAGAGAVLAAAPLQGQLPASARTCSDTTAPATLGPAGRSETLPVPARPSGSGRGPGQTHVVVRTGDTLWQLARDRAPASATTGDVAGLVGRVHRTNRLVIGPDPDLIRPGQRLVIPLPEHRPPLEEIP